MYASSRPSARSASADFDLRARGAQLLDGAVVELAVIEVARRVVCWVGFLLREERAHFSFKSLQFSQRIFTPTSTGRARLSETNVPVPVTVTVTVTVPTPAPSTAMEDRASAAAARVETGARRNHVAATLDSKKCSIAGERSFLRRSSCWKMEARLSHHGRPVILPRGGRNVSFSAPLPMMSLHHSRSCVSNRHLT